MGQKGLANWLKVIIIGTGICGLIGYGFLIPFFGKEIVDGAPELSHYYLPWLIFSYISAIPCFAVLVYGFLIANNIGNDKSFSIKNAIYLKNVSVLAIIDSAFVFVMNILYLLFNISHPGVAIMMLFVVFAGIAFSVLAAALSHLVKKAADLQEQSDYTI